MKTVPTPTAPLEAGQFLLRPWRSDEAAWYVAARDEVIFAWTTEPRALTTARLASVIEANNAEPRWVALAICDQDGRLVGNLSLVFDDEGKWAEASYWVAPEARGHGAAASALRMLVDWTFHNSAVDGVFLKIRPGNAASTAVARRCGFSKTGRIGRNDRYELQRPEDS